MTGESKAAADLRPGDVIHISHEHDVAGPCLIRHSDTDVQVTSVTEPLGDQKVAVEWCQCQRFLGACGDVTGCVVYPAEREVLCIGHVECAA